MSATLIPLRDSELSSIPANTEMYIPVRVAEAPLSNGFMRVYLRNGTAAIVNSRDLLRLEDSEAPSE